jgi:hypothetical protein
MLPYSPIIVWFVPTSFDPAGVAVLAIVVVLCAIGVLRLMSDLW